MAGTKPRHGPLSDVGNQHGSVVEGGGGASPEESRGRFSEGSASSLSVIADRRRVSDRFSIAGKCRR